MPIKRGTPLGYRKSITSIPDLRRQLRQDILKFRFKKIDGTIRIAFGTQMLSQIPIEDHPVNPGSSSPKVATFYDLKKGAWRSVSVRGDHVHIASDQNKKGAPYGNKNAVGKHSISEQRIMNAIEKRSRKKKYNRDVNKKIFK